jgi:hypothetical protein
LPFTLTTRTLFNIILKAIGLMFIHNIVMACVALIGTMFFWGKPSLDSLMFEVISNGLTLVLYSLAAWLLIFRSNRIIDSMKLRED